MEPVVEAIIKSLQTEPNEWRFESCTIRHKKKFDKKEFWIGDNSIQQIWNGYSNTTVFEKSQGTRIYDAYLEAKRIIGDKEQQDLLASL